MISCNFGRFFYVLPGSIPDPFHGCMKWIRIFPNEVDPMKQWLKQAIFPCGLH